MFHRITPRVPGVDRLWRTAQGTIQFGPPQLEASASSPILAYLNAASAAGAGGQTPGSLRTGAVGLYINGAQSQYCALMVGGNGSAGTSFGLELFAGTNSADVCVDFKNRAHTLDYLKIVGDGSGVLGYNGTANTLTWNAAGNVVINTPASGVPLTANGTSSTDVQEWSSTGAAGLFRIGWNTALTANAWNIIGNSTDDITFGGVGSMNLRLATSGAYRVVINGAGNVTVNAPSSGVPLTVNTPTSTVSILLTDSAAHASGLLSCVIGPATAALAVSGLNGDLYIAPRTSNANSVMIATPPGASGTAVTRLAINASAPYIQGYGPVAAALVDMTPDTGSFTGALTGFAANQNVSCHWVRMGNVVMLFLAGITAASTATTMTMTGLPAAITPASAFTVPCILEDNGNIALDGANFAASSGTITFGKAIGFSGGFTASGTKGIGANQWLSYALT